VPATGEPPLPPPPAPPAPAPATPPVPPVPALASAPGAPPAEGAPGGGDVVVTSQASRQAANGTIRTVRVWGIWCLRATGWGSASVLCQPSYKSIARSALELPASRAAPRAFLALLLRRRRRSGHSTTTGGGAGGRVSCWMQAARSNSRKASACSDLVSPSPQAAGEGGGVARIFSPPRPDGKSQSYFVARCLPKPAPSSSLPR
jgi:hypothetical protein